MKHEPIALYIFRFVLGLGLFAFMAMLYWSSVLMEQNLRELQQDVRALQSELHDTQTEILQAMLKLPKGNSSTVERSSSDTSSSPNQVAAKANHENLLTEDVFYAKTLPSMLPAGFQARGFFKSAIVGKPDHLHPFSNWANVSSWHSMCSVSVAQPHFGIYETLAPDMALRMEQRPVGENGGMEFWVELRDNVYWHPLNPKHFSDEVTLAPHFLQKHKVTAHDFKFYYDATMNPNVQEGGAASLRTYLDDIEEFKVIDDLTFVVRWKAQKVDGQSKVKYTAKGLTGSLRPLARFVYQYFADGSKIVADDEVPDTYRIDSVWAQNFAQHWARNIIASCGVWVFDGLTDKKIRFKRNPDHYQPLAALAEGYDIRFRESPDAVWQDFKSGALDTHGLSPEKVAELEDFLASAPYGQQKASGDGLKRIDYVARGYNYIGWNFAKPYFTSAKVRKAMTMAIDRKRIVEQNLNRMGVEITGPFFLASPSYDSSILPHPYSPQDAQRLLEEEGWFDRDGSGVRSKVINGKTVPFRFALTYYVKNPTSKGNCDYVATALKEIGVDCQLNGVDTADLSAAFDEKSFDAIYLGWALGSPPEEPKQLWHSSGAKEKGSSNAIGFANKDADAIIDALQYEYDAAKRDELYHRFHRIIHDEEPYTFLYSPKSALLYRDRVQNVFIPADRKDLVPGANVAEPDSSIFWLKTANK